MKAIKETSKKTKFNTRTDMRMIAKVEPGRETTLEQMDMYGKTFITDDPDLENREIVYQSEYKTVYQYRNEEGWQDLPENDFFSEGIIGHPTRHILRRLF